MIKHILLPLDGSALAEKVLPHAVALAETFNSKLTLLRVVYQNAHSIQSGIVNPIEWQMRKSEAESYLKSVQSRLTAVNVKSRIQILEGSPAHQIIEIAQQNDVDLIILSSHGSSGISEWNINSTVQKVLLRAYMPVMIIRAYRESFDSLKGLTYQRLLLPLDGSKRAECTLPLAESIRKVNNSKIFLAHIVEEPNLPRHTPLNEEEKDLLQKLNQMSLDDAEKYIRSIEDQFQQDQIVSIVESSKKPTVTLHNIIDQEDIDLVLISAHGYSGDNCWPYGKIALNFIAYGSTPLIIVQDLSKNDAEKSMAETFVEQTKGH